MKKGEIYEGIVKELKFPNKGIVESEGEKCTVKNTIPGQRISFRVTKSRHGDSEGNLLEVLDKAPNEAVIPNCPHFGKCGGCAFQSLSYEDQLSLKEKEVLDLLKDTEIGKYDGALASPDIFGYKNKMEFSFGDEEKGGELTLGLHKRGSFYDVVPVPGCRIVCEDVRKILIAVLEECRRQKLSYYHKMKHEGLLRHLMVRRSDSTGEILLGLVTTTQENIDLTAICDKVLSLDLSGRISGFLHIINDLPADTVQAERIDVLYGKDHFYEELLGLRFKVTPFSFFQTNSKGAEVLYSTARSFILPSVSGRDPVVFDLYSGTGTIAQMLSPVAKKVIGVEIVPEAVESAKENARLNNIENCEFICDDVLKALDTIEERPDFIVLDPPREGIHPKALPKLLEYGVQNMLYISCKPTSLARDLPAFIAAGYKVERLAMVDMFPWTANIEVVSLLQKMSNTRERTIDLGVEMEDYHRIKNRTEVPADATE
jgi:23S rRNA (uracil-5-)-methyltransferase RumA